MMYTVPFEAAHLARMTVQPAQAWMVDHVSDADAHGLESPWATTLMRDGRPIMAGGPIPLWEGRAYVWSFLSNEVTRRNFVEVTNFVREYLDGLPFKRLECAVECDHEAGHRWARVLGYELEAPRMRAFQIDGRDCALYARVRY